MQDKRIPTVHCSGPAKSSSQDGRELKGSLYDNHPWYYSHYDDDDLQMSECVCVYVCEHLSPPERATIEVTVAWSDPCISEQRQAMSMGLTVSNTR